MGGVSTQIAYEVPKTVSFVSPQQVIIQNNSVSVPVFKFCHLRSALRPPSLQTFVFPLLNVFTPFCPVETIDLSSHLCGGRL